MIPFLKIQPLRVNIHTKLKTIQNSQQKYDNAYIPLLVMQQDPFYLIAATNINLGDRLIVYVELILSQWPLTHHNRLDKPLPPSHLPTKIKLCAYLR